jgi:hypothetical protein
MESLLRRRSRRARRDDLNNKAPIREDKDAPATQLARVYARYFRLFGVYAADLNAIPRLWSL